MAAAFALFDRADLAFARPSRVALTEGDAFVTTAIACFIVAFARALDRPAVGRTAIGGIVLGLAVSSKFVAVGLLPWLGNRHSRFIVSSQR